MSPEGNCYDNAAMESFWSTLKTEAFPESGVFESKAVSIIASSKLGMGFFEKGA